MAPLGEGGVREVRGVAAAPHGFVCIRRRGRTRALRQPAALLRQVRTPRGRGRATARRRGRLRLGGPHRPVRPVDLSGRRPRQVRRPGDFDGAAAFAGCACGRGRRGFDRLLVRRHRSRSDCIPFALQEQPVTYSLRYLKRDRGGPCRRSRSARRPARSPVRDCDRRKARLARRSSTGNASRRAHHAAVSRVVDRDRRSRRRA